MAFLGLRMRPEQDKILRDGKEFFDAILAMEPHEAIERSRRINRIAVDVSYLAGEKVQQEGNVFAKTLVYAAFKGMHDIMEGLQLHHDLDETVQILKHPTTHAAIQRASVDLSSPSFDNMTIEFRKQGAFLSVNAGPENRNLQLNENYMTAGKPGIGCPLANRDKPLPYFNKCTDKIVDIYEAAYQEDMPRNFGQLALRSARDLVSYTTLRNPKTIIE